MQVDSQRQSSVPSYEHAAVTKDDATGDLTVEADGAKTLISRSAITLEAARRGKIGQVPTAELMNDLLNASFGTPSNLGSSA